MGFFNKLLEDIRDKESWIKRDLAHESELQKREIPVGEAPTGKCSQLTQVVWEWEVGPKAYFTETAYYCVAASKLFQVRLTHWKGDPRQEELQSTALEMARGCRAQAGQRKTHSSYSKAAELI